jgi:CxxC motif-containing protein
MPTEREIICVTCPKGCTLKVLHQGNQILDMVGAGCKRGKDYAFCELTDPRRMVASSVKVKNGRHPLVAVYTAKAFPKPLIPKLADALRKVEIEAPVTINQVVVENILDTGIDILASRDMPVAP